MEMDLQNIIEKIKTEGVTEADKRAADITRQAEEKAAAIIKEAEVQKTQILKDAKEEAKRLVRNGEEAVTQAARDVLLSLEGKIIELFDKVIKHKVDGALSQDVIKKMVAGLVEKYNTSGENDIEVLLSAGDKKVAEKVMLEGLKEDMKKGVTIKVTADIENGFRIGKKGENVCYDFTAEAIAEAFKTFLNPKVTEILNSVQRTADSG